MTTTFGAEDEERVGRKLPKAEGDPLFLRRLLNPIERHFRDIRAVNPGMVFRVHHVDHGGNVYATEHIEH